MARSRPTPVKALLAVPAVLLLLATGGCSGDDRSATDPAPTSGAAVTDEPQQAEQQGVPAAPGPVGTRGPVTVIQQPGQGVQVCLGPTTMVYPPSCGGPAVDGWDWETSGQGMSEEEAGTRFGSFALTGTWDGTTLTVTDAVPAALYDAAPVEEPTPGPVSRSYSEDTLALIADEAGGLPGATGAVPDGQGRVLVDVVYDDGSVQAYADQLWGDGVVVVTGALVDAG